MLFRMTAILAATPSAQDLFLQRGDVVVTDSPDMLPQEVGLEWLVPYDPNELDDDTLNKHPHSTFFLHNVTLLGQDSPIYIHDDNSELPTAVRACCDDPTGQGCLDPANPCWTYWFMGGCGHVQDCHR